MQMSKTQWGYITQSVHTRAHLMYINTQLILVCDRTDLQFQCNVFVFSFVVLWILSWKKQITVKK